MPYFIVLFFFNVVPVDTSAIADFPKSESDQPTCGQCEKNGAIKVRHFKNILFVCSEMNSFFSLIIPKIFIKYPPTDYVEETYYFSAVYLFRNCRTNLCYFFSIFN